MPIETPARGASGDESRASGAVYVHNGQAQADHCDWLRCGFGARHNFLHLMPYVKGGVHRQAAEVRDRWRQRGEGGPRLRLWHGELLGCINTPCPALRCRRLGLTSSSWGLAAHEAEAPPHKGLPSPTQCSQPQHERYPGDLRLLVGTDNCVPAAKGTPHGGRDREKLTSLEFWATGSKVSWLIRRRRR